MPPLSPGSPHEPAAFATRSALLLLTVWLVATALPLAGAITGPAAAFGRVRHAVLLAAAIGALAVDGWRVRRARGEVRPPAATRRSRFTDEGWALGLAWLPLVAVPALYAELPLVAAGIANAGRAFAPMRDVAVIRWELALFAPWLGTSPALALARALPWTPLSETLHLAYLSYYPIIYIPPALLWWEARRRPVASGPSSAGGPSSRRRSITGARDPQRAFATAAFTVLLAFLLCYTVFVRFPVQGPWYTWHTGDPGVLPLTGWVRAFVQGLLVAGSSRGTAFPSSHVAVSVAQTLVLARVAPHLAWIAAPATALLALGAVYGGYHYGVDALAGAVVGTAAGWAGPRIFDAVERRNARA